MMADTLTPEKRSWSMSRIRGKDTQPERAVQSALHDMGLRFRLHRRRLPGIPDIILGSRRMAIFVHGCFWHQHHGCPRATMPKSNTRYWKTKLANNIFRFDNVKGTLKQMGWDAIVVWECETKNATVLQERLRRIARKRGR